MEGAHRGGVPPGPPIPSKHIGAPGSGIWSRAANASAAALRPPASFLPRSAVLHQAAASSKGRAASLPPLQSNRPPMRAPTNPGRPPRSRRGRLRHVRPRPLLAMGQIARLAARPRTVLGAQSRHPVIRRRVPTLRERVARTSALRRIILAGPSGARK
ncbi:hypothetical protein NDU88_004190 [Pleurodeles waltl]|uniref:Uncharacterized protein n=1 Tax=Pleurodeles waltl TaxID=8319 RepID=A0AAV7UE86_PLEWA|nr:hypothetical protein NDU88_004190 [Pleurodeles waltl]